MSTNQVIADLDIAQEAVRAGKCSCDLSTDYHCEPCFTQQALQDAKRTIQELERSLNQAKACLKRVREIANRVQGLD